MDFWLLSAQKDYCKNLLYGAAIILLFLQTAILLIPDIYSEMAVILNFDDDWKSQYTYGKPILEKHGFKATFFVTCACITYQNSTVCNNNANPDSVLTWEELKSLKKAGHDIQSHGMTHKDLTSLSNRDLEYEIGKSKQCLLARNINSTIFANAFGLGSDNSTIIKMISKYYDIARSGYHPLTFLECDGWKRFSSQTDCRTLFDNGTLTFANRYSLRIANHNDFDATFHHNSTEILWEFIKAINSQSQYNTEGEINALPVLTYHNIDYVQHDNPALMSSHWINSTTDVNLFNEEIRFLRDNGFKVLTMSDLGYNKTSNHFFIKP
jgi:peptidoglycan/xylan/chitin deacetylase (PgdA/CDA1 family)